VSIKQYTTILSEETYARIEEYVAYLQDGGDSGLYLTSEIFGLGLDRQSLLAALLRTKKPQIFAESAVLGNGSDWTERELGILGDISIGMSVTIYDNGAHQNPTLHSIPFEGHLVYTPGALLRNDQGFTPADWQSVTINDKYEREKYYRLYERRLRPVFSYISQSAIKRGKPAFVTIPGIGCGQFAGPFKGQMGHIFQAALVRFLEVHGAKFPGVQAVYYDPYNECVDGDRHINGIEFFVRPLTPDNIGKSQLCKPGFLIKTVNGVFNDCELYSIVAWDHVSWPGNDYYLGDRVTDDGVKAAATDTMYKTTGIQGVYCKDKKKYVPPSPYKNWKHVVDENELRLDTSAGLFLA